MNKVLRVSKKTFLRDFFRDRISISVCCITLIFLIGNYFFFFQKKALNFFPNEKNLKIDFYSDSIDNGKSVIIAKQQLDSFVSMNFILKDGFVRPYSGIAFENKSQKEYNISFFNRMKIDVSGKGIKPILIYLILKDSSTSFEGSQVGNRNLYHYLEITPERKVFKLTLNDFKTPDWWFDKYNLSPATIKEPCLTRMYRLAVSTGPTPAQNKEQSIQINSIIFYRDNAFVVLLMIFIQLLTMILAGMIFYFRTKPKKQNNFVTINYQAVPIEHIQKSKNSFLEYINQNFDNSELNLRLISEQTGITQRNIAESISTQFNCNLKTYINQIRINEAQRLLKETDLNISEIAYKVWFSSPSNFNRVFKNLTGKNPSEFLQDKN